MEEDTIQQKKQYTSILNSENISYLDWNALTNDAAGANTKEEILKNFYDTTGDKTSIVLLMHDAPNKIFINIKNNYKIYKK